MKTLKILFLSIFLLFSTSQCTSWPSLIFFVLGGGGGGGGALLLPPGGGSSTETGTGTGTETGTGTGTATVTGTGGTDAATAISMLTANGNGYLYVGFDDPTYGLKVFRYTGTTPGATSGTMSSASWTQLGTDGLGASAKYIMTAASLYDSVSDKNYLYIVIGNELGSSAIKVVTQAD